MKALTLWQPWASLVALGVKTIETRSWSTSYRGPLAIHASKKAVYGPIGDYYAETWFSDVVHDDFRCYCEADGVGPPCTRGATRTPCLTNEERLATMLPLGAVIATCTLVDVVPTADLRWTTLWSRWAWQDAHGSPIYPPQPDPRVLHFPVVVPAAAQPYGDFSPGRFAWLLADIKPLVAPVPAKGRQGLWTPDPDLAEAVAAALDATAV